MGKKILNIQLKILIIGDNCWVTRRERNRDSPRKICYSDRNLQIRQDRESFWNLGISQRKTLIFQISIPQCPFWYCRRMGGKFDASTWKSTSRAIIQTYIRYRTYTNLCPREIYECMRIYITVCVFVEYSYFVFLIRVQF